MDLRWLTLMITGKILNLEINVFLTERYYNMNITLPDHFYTLSKYEQEEYLKVYLTKYHEVTDDIMKLLGKLRGEHRKLSVEDVN